MSDYKGHRIRLTVRLPAAILVALRMLAKQQDSDVNEVICQLLKERLGRRS